MALTRGQLGLFPCPVCLVPKDMQSDLTTIHERRTAKSTEDIIDTVQRLNATDREEVLKSLSIRNVKV